YTNLWVTTEKLKTRVRAKDSWIGQGIWNADRRTATRFDPLTDALRLQIGSYPIDVPPGSLKGTVKNYRYVSPRGHVPVVNVQLSLVKQTLKWAVKRDGISETVPVTLRHTTIIGGRGYLLDEAFNAQGVFKVSVLSNDRKMTLKLSHVYLTVPSASVQVGVEVPIGERI